MCLFSKEFVFISLSKILNAKILKKDVWFDRKKHRNCIFINVFFNLLTEDLHLPNEFFEKDF
jgi:hypothetical protein